jgi:hypothetical protein
MLGRFFGFCIFPGKCVAIRTVYTYTYGYRPKDGRHLHAPNSYLTDRFPPTPPSLFFSLPDPAGSTAVIIHPSIPIRTCPSLSFFSFLFLLELFPLRDVRVADV